MYLLIIPVKILELFDRFLSVPLVCKDNEKMNTDSNLTQLWIRLIFSDILIPVKINPRGLTLSLARSMTSLSLCKLFIMSTPICSEITIKIMHFRSWKYKFLAWDRNLITLMYGNEFKFSITQHLSIKCETWNLKCKAQNCCCCCC